MPDLSDSTVFQFRIGQAISTAQRNARQVGLLIVSLEPADEIELASALLAKCLDHAWTRLRGTHRDSDAAYQINGTQSAVLLPTILGFEDAVFVAKKILTNIADPVQCDGLRVNFRGRIGIAVFPEHGTSPMVLMHAAETALTTARKTNQSYAIYSPESNCAQRPTIRLSELRQAIVQNQLLLHYQPKIDLKTNSIAGLEVLTRWRHPEHGLILPDEFIPVAERTGLIIPLTLWVLHRSLIQCRSWNDLGFAISVAYTRANPMPATILGGEISQRIISIGI